jgi:drug/metabolite transporter (DMT)-like permease
MMVAAVLGFLQFVVNFNAVYLAEHHITSGLVATVFALLLIPNSLLGWAILKQKPSGRFGIGSVIAVAGIALLFAHELSEHPARTDAIMLGIGLALLGMLGASTANIYQALDRVKGHSLFALLTWAMVFGALLDGVIALAVAGPPVIEMRLGYWLGLIYLAVFASALAFSLYLPVVRIIGPGKAAYSSVLVPIIAMAFSTWIEDGHHDRRRRACAGRHGGCAQPKPIDCPGARRRLSGAHGRRPHRSRGTPFTHARHHPARGL